MRPALYPVVHHPVTVFANRSPTSVHSFPVLPLSLLVRPSTKKVMLTVEKNQNARNLGNIYFRATPLHMAPMYGYVLQPFHKPFFYASLPTIRFVLPFLRHAAVWWIQIGTIDLS
jgi:hypothetical protein